MERSNIDKLLPRLTKGKKRKKTQITKTRNKNGGIITNSTEIWRIIGDYYEQLYTNKLDNLDKMINVSPRNTESIKTKLWTNRKSK